MLFSSISFIYYFLPFILILYFSVPRKFKNGVLFLCSLLFYFLGEPKYAWLLIFSTLVDYSHSLFIESHRGSRAARAALISSIVINLSMLGFFKYADFLLDNANQLLGTNYPLPGVTLPLGISFFTFQTMSYTIDVYRNSVKAQKNPLTLGTYVALFPQLIAGPVVRYKTIADELTQRIHSFTDIAYGIKRFIIGLAKKVLLANTLGELSNLSANTTDKTLLILWIGAVAFAMQIYFDFSGYSDMAIGLGRIFGFHFLENFNYPYISKSISEFWRRWHISLGTWFRDYVYIPLGGSHGSKLMWLRNILIVWFLTGFWHGAGWNFVLWGLYFGFLIALEKLFLLAFLKRLPSFIQHFYVLLAVVISFVIFNTTHLRDIVILLKGMFGFNLIPLTDSVSLYYLRSYSVTFILATLGSTPLFSYIASKSFMKNPTFNRFYAKLESADIHTLAHKIFGFLEPLCYISLMLIITGYLVDSSFNPFLYFRF